MHVTFVIYIMPINPIDTCVSMSKIISTNTVTMQLVEDLRASLSFPRPTTRLFLTDDHRRDKKTLRVFADLNVSPSQLYRKGPTAEQYYIIPLSIHQISLFTTNVWVHITCRFAGNNNLLPILDLDWQLRHGFELFCSDFVSELDLFSDLVRMEIGWCS